MSSAPTAHSQIFIATHDGMAVKFNETDVRPMGRVARGVRGVNLRKGDFVVSVCAVSQEGNRKDPFGLRKGLWQTDAGRQLSPDQTRRHRRHQYEDDRQRPARSSRRSRSKRISEIMIITQQAKLIRLGCRQDPRNRPKCPGRHAHPNRRRRPRNRHSLIDPQQNEDASDRRINADRFLKIPSTFKRRLGRKKKKALAAVPDGSCA